MKQLLIWVSFIFTLASTYSWALSPSLSIKGEVYREFGFEIRDAGKLTPRQLSFVQDQLRFGPLHRFVPLKLRAIQMRDAIPGVAQAFGVYSPFEEVIYLSTDFDRFEEAVIHEIFHVISFQYPNSYIDFLKQSGWKVDRVRGSDFYTFSWVDEVEISYSVSGSEFEFRFELEKFGSALNFPVFPSDYSKAGPADMFAEIGTATTLILNNTSSPHYDLVQFSKTALAQWMIEFIEKGNLNP